MNQVQVIEVTEPSQISELLKLEISKMLTETSKELIEALPKREDFETESEYELIKRMTMIDLIDQTKTIKHDIFKQILDNYNNLITELNNFKNKAISENKESELMQTYLDYSAKKTLIISIGVSVLFPSLIPIVIIIDIPKLGTNRLLKKYHNIRLERNKTINEAMRKVQEPLFELTDSLRTDYHRSNEELAELEHKAITGEDISEDIKRILSPERIGLEEVKEASQIDNLQKEKVLVKEKSKQD